MQQEIQKLEKPLNFDTWTERASSAGKLNTNPSGKSNLQKYQDALDKISELENKAKEKKLIASQEKTLHDLKQDIPYLKSVKDITQLSQTAKSHLQEVYWSVRAGHKRDIHSKYMENGKAAEDDGIALISKLDDPDLFEMGMSVYEKCTLLRQRNNHFEGECDIKSSPYIQDIKCCWDIFTFFKHVNELIFSEGVDEEGKVKTKWIWNAELNRFELPADNIKNDDYECQGIVYMELYGEEFFRLRYCLVNMPDEILKQNLRWLCNEYGGNDENPAYQDAMMEFIRKHKYDHLPLSSRVVTFQIKRNLEKYLLLCKKVEKAREYLNWYAEEMFYFENPDLRPKNLLTPNLVDVIGQSITETEDSYVEEKDETLDNRFEYLNKDCCENIKNVVEEIAQISGTTTEQVKDFLINESENIIKEKVISETITQNENGSIIVDAVSIKKEQQINPPDVEIDTFALKIQKLSNIDDAVAFYMDNADKIDDTKYETIFYAKKDALSAPAEAPKIKPKLSPSSPVQVPKSEPAKVYTGDEIYSISDGINTLIQLKFEEAKDFVIKYLIERFKEWTDYNSHRNNITAFYAANRELIERDITFKEKISDMSKKECDILVEKKRKEMLDLVNKM